MGARPAAATGWTDGGISCHDMSVEELLTPADYRALHAFRFAIRQFLRFSEDAAREAGIEPQQHQLLLAIKGMPPGREPDIAALADRLQLRHHSVVELVDRLVGRGLVERLRSEHDRRQVLIRITPAGQKVIHHLSVHHQRQLQSAGPALVQVLEDIIERGKSSAPAQEALASTTRSGRKQ